MNLGTKLRTAMIIVVLVLVILAMFNVCFTSVIAKVIVSAILVAAVGTVYWYNNDWTEAACHGTGVARQEKREQKDGYIGDFFYQDSERPEFDTLDTNINE